MENTFLLSTVKVSLLPLEQNKNTTEKHPLPQVGILNLYKLMIYLIFIN